MRKSWSDQRVFKLARKLNTVIYRNIVLNEWAKIVLGEKNANQLLSETATSLDPGQRNPLSNAVSNEFGKFFIFIVSAVYTHNLQSTKCRKCNKMIN